MTSFYTKIKEFFKANRILILVIVMVLPFRLYGITNPIIDSEPFRQAQTATIALNFYKTGINLFKTELDIFGYGRERFLTLEFPVYEAIVALLYRIFFFADFWGRIVSIIAGFIGAIYLYKLCDLLFQNRKISLFSTLFFLFAPLNMNFQRTYMIDATVIAFLLSGLYYFCRWVINGINKCYILGIILLSTGFMMKGVYGPFWLLPMFIFYLKNRMLFSGMTIKLLIMLAVPLISLAIWQNHVNIQNTVNNQSYFTTTNLSHLNWNFGTWNDRLDYDMWNTRLTQLNQGITLKPGLIFFLLGVIFVMKLKNKEFVYAWLLSQFIYFFTLFRIQSHNYYQMVIIPSSAIVMAIGFNKIVQHLSKLPKFLITGRYAKISLVTLISVFLFTFFVWRSWMHARWSFVTDMNWYQRMLDAGNSVAGGYYGILVDIGYNWNSVYTYYTKRKMMLVDVHEMTVDKLIEWQKMGYTFVMFHNFVKYQDLFKKGNFKEALDYISQYPKVYNSEDFIVYLLKI